MPCVVLLALATTTGAAWASKEEPVRNADFGARKDAGYVATYDAAPHIAAYARVVYESYARSYEDARRMQAAIARLVAAPSAASLAQARQAWRNARVAYLQTETFRFYEGPIDHGPDKTGEEGPEGRINGWPMNEAVIDYVAGDPRAGLINDLSAPISREEILKRDQVSDEADITTGWHAIEFLLWGQDRNDFGPGARPVSDFTDSPTAARRKAYLTIVTDLLVSDLKGLKAAWAPGVADNYAARFVKLDQKAALSRIMTGLTTLAGFEVANDRLATALDSGDQEDEHSCFSDNTTADFIYDVRGIRNVWFGDVGDVDGPGLDELVASVAPGLSRKVTALINRAESQIAEIDAPFDRVLASPKDSAPRREAEAAYEALVALTERLREVGAALGVRVIAPSSGG